MTTKQTLKTFFQTGDTPTQTQFEQLIDECYRYEVFFDRWLSLNGGSQSISSTDNLLISAASSGLKGAQYTGNLVVGKFYQIEFNVVSKTGTWTVQDEVTVDTEQSQEVTEGANLFSFQYKGNPLAIHTSVANNSIELNQFVLTASNTSALDEVIQDIEVIKRELGILYFEDSFEDGISEKWDEVTSEVIASGGNATIDLTASTGNQKLVKSFPSDTNEGRVQFKVNVRNCAGYIVLARIATASSTSAITLNLNVNGGKWIFGIAGSAYNSGTDSYGTTGALTLPDVGEDTDIEFEIVFDNTKNAYYVYCQKAFVYSSFAGTKAEDLVSFSIGELLNNNGSGVMEIKECAISTDKTRRITSYKNSIIWAGGQSNMVGFGGAGDFDANVDDPERWLWFQSASDNKTFFRAYKEGAIQNATGNAIYLTYIRSLSFAEDVIPFVCYNAAGSTGFGTDANPREWHPTGIHYDRSTRHLAALLSGGAMPTFDCEMHSMIWHQGETDATLGYNLNGNEYGDRLAALETALRAIDGVGNDIPFIAGELSPTSVTTGQTWSAAYDNINAQLATFAEGSFRRGLASSSIPSVLAYDNDDVHIDGPGLRTMGMRYATLYNQLK